MKLKLLTLMALTAGLAASAASTAPDEHLKSLSKEGLDPAISPAENFYMHVNKKWMDSHPLGAEYARFGKFDTLRDTSEARVKDIVTNLQSTNPAPGTVAFKVATIYELAMDSARRNAEGAKPIMADLARIEATAPSQMEDLMLWMHSEYASPFFSAGPSEDMANSSVYAMYVGDGGIGMGDRDYYLKDDARNKEVREAYKKLIVGQMRNAGYSKKDAERICRNVMKIETALAEAALTREESRNVTAMYNPYTLAQLKDSFPAINWDRYFIETMGIETPDNFIVTEPRSVKAANDLIASLDNRAVKDYYLWKYVNQASSSLSDKFTDTAFEFSKVISGVQQQRPRWKRALSTTEGLMGEAIGELYVEKYFPQSSKDYMIELVENLRTALGKHLIELPWMSTETKLNALKKLNAFTVKIGYPDKWKDYSDMQIDPKLSFYENRHNASMWRKAKRLAKWGKPVDRTEWGMTPQTVNAYYSPMANEIVFPAGILQAPFFDAEASDAENYGGIGVVIGHEMTHGFDDQGRNFDAQGNMTNWWTDDDAKAFDALAKKLVDQYSAVEVLPGLNANGEYTLGENIADQGGLRIAMTAFLDAQKKKGVDIQSTEALVDGIEPLKVFYLNYANLWGQNIRDNEIRNRTMSDVHSLGVNRVNVAVRNLAPFFEAFSITDGQTMFRPEQERVIIW